MLPHGLARALGLVSALTLVPMHGLLVAPARAQAPPASPATRPPSVAGTWTSVIAAPTGRIDLTFQLAQDGEQVRGTYDYRGPVMAALNVRVTGTLQGNALTLFEQGAAAPVLEARVEGRSFSGVYRGSSMRTRLDATRVDPD